MKNKKQCLMLVLALTLVLCMSVGILIACKNNKPNTHECKSKCEDCGLCLRTSCEEEACKQKCTCELDNDPPEPPANNSAYTKDMDISANPHQFEDYALERGEKEKQLIVYWREAEHNYADNDLWMWHDQALGRAYELHECEYGAKAIINVASDITKVGFIVRKNTKSHTDEWDDAGKVIGDDREFILTGDVTEIYLTGANKYQFTSTDGGKTLKMIKVVSQMAIQTYKTIAYTIAPSVKITNVSQITVKCDGVPIEIEKLSSLNKTTANGVITLKEKIDLSKNYVVTIDDYDAKAALPMDIFDSAEFTSAYHYDGELGAIVKDGSVDFKLWAPTASKVALNIFENGSIGEAVQTITMTKPAADDKGVWSLHVDDMNDVLNKYYTYTVATSAGEQEAVDPYARSAGVNGKRGMVINLADTNPESFADSPISIDSYTDAIIWETHVRDFSNNISDSNYKGKYLAFTETGLTNSVGIPIGVDYLTNLGVTHIHIMPAYDYGSVDESSEEPQFNWGYDPVNYNVPEGSYSTNPRDGRVRINEFKQMVQALHEQGLGVIMDVVYNHTFDKNSNLNKVVPNYYYRYKSDGSNSSDSGCGNDTASERYMYSKYMVDSAKYWVSEYKLDGLRFDLMGLHDINTMQAIEQAVHEINPNAIIYGEGWSMNTAAKKGTVMADQKNISKITATSGSAGAVAVFNDAIRDGLHGGNGDGKGYLANGSRIDDVIFGLRGGEVKGSAGWSVKDAMVVNYISAHDNYTLWDNLQITNKTATKSQLLAMNRMGATVIMLSKGTPFMTAGEEMLRTKPNGDGTFNHNSYNSSDEINNLKWESLTQNSDEYTMMQYYKGLIAMRKGFDAFHDLKTVVSVEKLTYTQVVAGTNGAADREVKVATKALVVKYTIDDEVVATAVINGDSASYNYALPVGNWSLVCDGTQAGVEEISAATGEVTVPAGTVYVYVKK